MSLVYGRIEPYILYDGTVHLTPDNPLDIKPGRPTRGYTYVFVRAPRGSFIRGYVCTRGICRAMLYPKTHVYTWTLLVYNAPWWVYDTIRVTTDRETDAYIRAMVVTPTFDIREQVIRGIRYVTRAEEAAKEETIRLPGTDGLVVYTHLPPCANGKCLTNYCIEITSEDVKQVGVFGNPWGLDTGDNWHRHFGYSYTKVTLPYRACMWSIYGFNIIDAGQAGTITVRIYEYMPTVEGVQP